MVMTDEYLEALNEIDNMILLNQIENEKTSIVENIDMAVMGRKELAEIITPYFTATIPSSDGKVLMPDLPHCSLNPIPISSKFHPSLRPKTISSIYCLPCKASHKLNQKFVTCNASPNINLELNASYFQSSFEDIGLPEDFQFNFCDPSQQIDLRNLILANQLHDKNHRKSCFKNNSDYCRYHFPWKLRKNTIIKVLKLKGAKSYSLRVLAKRNDVWINNYNG